MNIQAIHINPRKGDVRHSLVDITKAGNFLIYNPFIDFQVGLWKTVKWFTNNLIA